MSISAKDVNKLRKMTGAGMMDCKNALVEANGDFDAAIDLLRKKGQKIAAKRADRETSEGAVFVYTSDDHKTGIAMALRCETEPVSATDEFKNLGQKIFQLAVDKAPSTTDELLSLDIDGKPILENIVELSGRIGEKIEIGDFIKLSGEKIVSYVHGKSIGVLVDLGNVNGSDVNDAGRDVAMQIAAMKPIAVDESNVESTLIEKERELGKEKAKQEGKPEHILEKVAEGYVKKFLKENTLLNQSFVKDPNLTVKQYLDQVSSGLTVNTFQRVSIGR